MDRLMELSQYLVKRIKEMPDKYYLILEPEMVNVSFWYIPPRLRNTPHTPEKEKQLGEVSNWLEKFLRETWKSWEPRATHAIHTCTPTKLNEIFVLVSSNSIPLINFMFVFSCVPR